MWNSIAEMHAALNDLPPALFVAAVVFELAGHLTKRESLRAAGYWALIGAAVTAVFAVWSGLGAEDVIEHGSVMHRSIERHETLAIMFTVFVGGMAAWRIWRGGALTSSTFKQYVALSVVGMVGILWTAKVGGRIVFEYAGGIETRILEASLAERQAGHAHAPGEEDHEHEPGTPEHEHDTEPAAADHDHPPGTPEHEH